MHRRFLISQIGGTKRQARGHRRSGGAKGSRAHHVQASIEKLKATLAPLQQRVEIRQQLFQKELGSKLTYLTELQDLVGQQQEILVQQSRSNEADAAISVLTETRTKTVAEYERGLFEGLAKAEEKAAGLARTSSRPNNAPVCKI